jgi:hypothetical protein
MPQISLLKYKLCTKTLDKIEEVLYIIDMEGVSPMGYKPRPQFRIPKPWRVHCKTVLQSITKNETPAHIG